MESEELADFADPAAWREWVCACVKARRADQELAGEERRRERAEAEYRAALHRRTAPYEAAQRHHWAWSSPSPPDQGPDPFLPAWKAAQAEAAACEQRARASVRERLENGTLTAFGRRDTIEAPLQQIKPRVAKYLEPVQNSRVPSTIACEGARYVVAFVFDPLGLPLDQGALAYADQAVDPFKIQRFAARMAGGREVALPAAPLELARRAIGRRCLRDNGRDGAEEAALAALREALRARLRRGSLLAFRDGEAVPAEEFADGARLGDVGAWENEPRILVRPLEPPKRAAVQSTAPSAVPVRKKGKSGRTPDWERHRFDGEFNRYREQNPNASREKVNRHLKDWMLEFSKSSSSPHPGKRGVAARLRELWNKLDPREGTCAGGR